MDIISSAASLVCPIYISSITLLFVQTFICMIMAYIVTEGLLGNDLYLNIFITRQRSNNNL